MNRRALCAVWAISALIVTACSSGSDMVAPEKAVVIANDATAPPGTPLGAGFRVERGSVLLGAPFPLTEYENATGIGEGFMASLAVTAEPYRTFRRYIDRAVDLGFGIDPGPGGYCEVVRAQDPPPHYVRCSASTPDKDPFAGRPQRCNCERRVSVGLIYGRSDRAIPLSFITLSFHPAHNPERFAREPGAPPGPTGRVPTIRVPSDQHLPRMGGLIGEVCQRELRVVAGSRVVARYGDSALLEVTGDPENVFARYSKQVGAVRPPEHAVLPDGELWANQGDGYSVKMFRTAQRTWLRASIYEDSAC